MTNTIIGRKEEKEKLYHFLKTNEAEFLAVYGRRRVGKTFLINEFFKNTSIYFEITGQLKASLPVQLDNFSTSFGKAFLNGISPKRPATWKEAFNFLADICARHTRSKIILFFDEVPWLATKRSGFLSALEYFWNTFASRQNNIKLIVCGSASSWMVQKIVNSKGGLHNRITASIRLLPFNLSETKKFLVSRGIKFNDRQILDVYMVMGGIPHYLKQIKKGMSAVQNINQICFRKDGFLSNEFDRLYDSLFENSKDYKKFVTALSKARYGLERHDLLKVLGVMPGGTLTRTLSNLEEAGFITAFPPYGKKTKGTRYRLTDEYSYFYLRWIKDIEKSFLSPEANFWQAQSNTQRFKIWAGYTFETICVKHSFQIKKALGISGVIAHESSWTHYSKTDKGTQIDWLFDRDDNVISICEIKGHQREFTIDKKYANVLKDKIEIFRNQTGTQKAIFLVIITIAGIKKNSYFTELIDNEVGLKDLMQ